MGTRKLFYLFGVGIIVLGFLLGFKYQDSGCGTCGGHYRYFPKLTTAIQYVPSFSRSPQSVCATMGCRVGITFSLFLDIYFGGLTIIFLGCFIRSKQK